MLRSSHPSRIFCVWRKRSLNHSSTKYLPNITTSGKKMLRSFKCAYAVGAVLAQALVVCSQDAFHIKLGGDGLDAGHSVVANPDGSYMLAGQTTSFGHGDTDALVAKISASGTVEWAKAFGSSDSDTARHILRTTDGHYVFIGTIELTTTNRKDILVVKLQADGTVVWSKTVGTTANEDGWFIKETSDGGFVFSATRDGFLPNPATLAGKLSSAGDVVWSKYISTAVTSRGSGYTDGYLDVGSIVETSDGGFLLSGQLTDHFQVHIDCDSQYSFYYGCYYHGDTDYIQDATVAILVKLDQSGTFAWSEALVTPSVSAYTRTTETAGSFLHELSDGRLVHGARMRGNDNGDLSTIFSFLNASDGSLLGSPRLYSATWEDGDNVGFAVDDTTDGGFVLTGYTRSFYTGDRDILVSKFDSYGDVTWSYALSGETATRGDDRDEGRGIQVDSDGNYIVIGTTYVGQTTDTDDFSTPATDSDIVVAKIDPSRDEFGACASVWEVLQDSYDFSATIANYTELSVDVHNPNMVSASLDLGETNIGSSLQRDDLCSDLASTTGGPDFELGGSPTDDGGELSASHWDVPSYVVLLTVAGALVLG